MGKCFARICWNRSTFFTTRSSVPPTLNWLYVGSDAASAENTTVFMSACKMAWLLPSSRNQALVFSFKARNLPLAYFNISSIFGQMSGSPREASVTASQRPAASSTIRLNVSRVIIPMCPLPFFVKSSSIW